MKSKERIAVYPGSFDPITYGHIDIIQRISPQFDRVIVLVSEAQEKSYLFSGPDRIRFIEKSLTKLKNVDIEMGSGLTVDFCKKSGAQVIVRGLRAVVDFEYEMTMANMNKTLNAEIETMLVFAGSDYYFISSRGVKEVARFGGALTSLVPDHVASELKKKLLKGKTK